MKVEWSLFSSFSRTATDDGVRGRFSSHQTKRRVCRRIPTTCTNYPTSISILDVREERHVDNSGKVGCDGACHGSLASRARRWHAYPDGISAENEKHDGPGYE